MDLLSSNSTNLRRCTMVVLDEADRMFEMGFEYQMRSIVNNIRSQHFSLPLLSSLLTAWCRRPDRQMLLFSATMKKRVENFAREMIRNPIRVAIGTIGHANPDIQQVRRLQ
jgi:ATP-dependent RNA helicase DDX42